MHLSFYASIIFFSKFLLLLHLPHERGLTPKILAGKITPYLNFTVIILWTSKDWFMSNTKSKRDDTHQCEKCLPAYCCNYFAFGIDEPETRRDYESLLWKIAHENTSIYIYRQDWFIMIHNRCNFLMLDNKCAIYEHRPYMCREHSTESVSYTHLRAHET